jgi:hypothetical protein
MKCDSHVSLFGPHPYKPLLWSQAQGYSCDKAFINSIKWPLSNPIKRMKIVFKCPNFKIANF